MTTFTRTWNSAYEAQPADTENIDLGAGRIRDLKEDINERMAVNHSWAGDADDGEHIKVIFKAPLGSDPSNAANKGILYTKDVSSKVELFFIDEDGNVIQLTTGGSINVATPDTAITGEIRMWPTASPPTNWLIANGSAVSRTTYATLFGVIGTTYGVGDGSTTFNLPDFRGRSPIGVGTGDATAATAWALAEKGGDETKVLTAGNMPTGATYSKRGVNVVQAGTGTSSGGTTPAETPLTGASDTPVNIMSPVLGINFIIKT